MFVFRLADETSVREAVSWRYDPPYDVYNLDPDSKDTLQTLLDPNTACHTFSDECGDLVGFCTFGSDAQVPGGDYSGEGLDIGMGIRPDLTGRGNGSVYASAVLDFAMLKFEPTTVRVTVAEFNHRAKRVWEKVGFCAMQRFERIPDAMPFVVMAGDSQSVLMYNEGTVENRLVGKQGVGDGRFEMQNLNEAVIRRIVEQVAQQVLVQLEEEQLGTQDKDSFARFFDHTLLKPDATEEQIAQLCREAREYGFATVCINPVNVESSARHLAGSGVLVCTVVGFPLGATFTQAKVFETEMVLRHGAAEVDMVINVGALKGENYELVKSDITAVAQACHNGNAILKVIIEAALLTDREKEIACQLAMAAGADFAKTSTGFGPGGATAEDVALMRRVVGPTMGVKAAGGIRTYDDAKTMIAAGATRIGASASVKMMQEKAAADVGA